jgi:hypothetical protein
MDVLLEFIATAQRSVLFTGAELDRDRALLGALHAAALGRELAVCVVLATPAAGDIERVRALGRELFHDRAFCAALHVPAPACVHGEIPFCLLVDHQRGLLLAGAPPLLESDERSVSAGFLIDDAEAVVALETQWQTLIHTDALLPLSATPAK